MAGGPESELDPHPPPREPISFLPSRPRSTEFESQNREQFDWQGQYLFFRGAGLVCTSPVWTVHSPPLQDIVLLKPDRMLEEDFVLARYPIPSNPRKMTPEVVGKAVYLLTKVCNCVAATHQRKGFGLRHEKFCPLSVAEG